MFSFANSFTTNFHFLVHFARVNRARKTGMQIATQLPTRTYNTFNFVDSNSSIVWLYRHADVLFNRRAIDTVHGIYKFQALISIIFTDTSSNSLLEEQIVSLIKALDQRSINMVNRVENHDFDNHHWLRISARNS